MQHTRRLHNNALGRGQCSCSQKEANNPWTNFPSNHALNHERTAQKRGETQAGSLRQTGSVRGQKTAILYRRMSGANKSYLRRFAGLCALTVQTASRTAAGEPPTGPRQANNIGDSVRPEQSSRRRQNKRALDFQRGSVQITAGLRLVQRSGLFLFTKIVKGILWGKTRADPDEF